MAANPRRKTMATFSTKWIVGAGTDDTRDGKWKDFGKFTVQGKSIEQAAGRAISILRKKTKQPRLSLALAQEHEDDAYTFEMSAPGFTGSASIDRVMARRKNYGSITTLSNPYGLSMGKGKAVRTASGNRTHVKGGGNLTLCGSKVGKGSDAKVITCYRCIKLVNMDGLHTVKRDLRYGKRTKHYMVPGGREGKYVSGVDVGSSLSDAEFEQMMGDSNYPTQSLGMIEHIREERTGAKRKRAARKGSLTRRRKKAGAAMIANPRSYKMGYSKGIKDYRSSSPTPASTIRKRSMDYQVGYLEGYAKSGRGR